jgi:phage virion morphogenesis protein
VAGALIKLHLDAVVAEATLRRLEDGARNALPLFTEIGSALEASTRDRIGRTKTAPDGTPWLDLSPAWIARKKARGFSGGTLTMRGDLLNSVAFEAAAAHVDIIAGPTEYAALHQYGGTPGMAPGPAAVPARPFLGVSADDADEIDEATRDWLSRMISG